MKTKKKLSVIIISLFIFQLLFINTGAVSESTVNYRDYSFTNEPKSLTISYYSDIYSRGFSYYTDSQTKNTELYIVEGKVDDSYDFKNNSEKITGNCIRVSNKANSHQVYCENLKPGTEYSYKLGGNGKYIFGTFKTEENEDDITIINFTDSQTKNADLLYYWENTVATAYKTADPDDIDFIAFTGDLYDNNMTASSVDKYSRWGFSIDTVKNIIGDTPFMTAMGNHESQTSGLYRASNCIDFQGKTDSDYDSYYSFDYGNTHFVTLPYATDRSEYLDSAAEWLKTDLKAANDNPRIQWIVVQMHHGPYTTGDHGADPISKKIVEKFAPIFSEYHVDLVIQGHDHTYSKTLPYLWDSTGYTTDNENNDIINNDIKNVTYNEQTYDYEPNGTYYISCGAAGHRIGENKDYADSENGYFLDNYYKIKIGSINVDSEFAKAGDKASNDLGKTMFGVLRIEDNTLVYDFYVAKPDETAVLFDTVSIYKEHKHFFREIADEKYIVEEATCTTPAKYYKSCTCGEISSESFTYGKELGHLWSEAIYEDENCHKFICLRDNTTVITEEHKFTADQNDENKEICICGAEKINNKPIVENPETNAPEPDNTEQNNKPETGPEIKNEEKTPDLIKQPDKTSDNQYTEIFTVISIISAAGIIISAKKAKIAK